MRPNKVTWVQPRSYEIGTDQKRTVDVTEGLLGPMRMATVTWGWLRSREITWGQMRSAKVWGWSHEVGWGHMGLHDVGLGQMRSYEVTRNHKRSHKVAWGHMKSNVWRMLYSLVAQLAGYPAGRICGFSITGYRAYCHISSIQMFKFFKSKNRYNGLDMFCCYGTRNGETCVDQTYRYLSFKIYLWLALLLIRFNRGNLYQHGTGTDSKPDVDQMT